MKDDLEHLEVRIEKARSVLCQVQAKPATTPLKMTHDEMQQRMKVNFFKIKYISILIWILVSVKMIKINKTLGKDFAKKEIGCAIWWSSNVFEVNNSSMLNK